MRAWWCVFGLVILLAALALAGPGRAQEPAPTVTPLVETPTSTETPTETPTEPPPTPTSEPTQEPTQTPWIVTETPALEPSATITPTAEIEPLTPTPLVVILVTPTPDPHPIPPSLQIPSLFAELIGSATGNRPLFAFDILPQLEDSPIPKEVDAVIDERFLPWLLGRQKEYREMTGGKYAQMLASHFKVPSDGEHLYPDGWYTRPSDQGYSWQEMNAIQYEPLPFSISVNTYQGLDGFGYLACFRMGWKGQIWQRCAAWGPDVLMTHGWQPEQEGGP